MIEHHLTAPEDPCPGLLLPLASQSSIQLKAIMTSFVLNATPSSLGCDCSSALSFGTTLSRQGHWGTILIGFILAKKVFWYCASYAEEAQGIQLPSEGVRSQVHSSQSTPHLSGAHKCLVLLCNWQHRWHIQVPPIAHHTNYAVHQIAAWVCWPCKLLREIVQQRSLPIGLCDEEGFTLGTFQKMLQQ